MIFLTLYLIGVAIAWLLIAHTNDENSSNIPSLMSVLSWIIILLLLLRFLIEFLYYFLLKDSKTIKNLYKRIFKQ